MKWIDPADAASVPVGAQFMFAALFGKKNDNGIGNDGLSDSDFNKKWAIFRVVIEYDNVKLQHYFNREWTSTAIEAADPRLGPHISKRQP
jgi:hypothetical protein